MKKFLTLIITCFLSLSLAGCSNSKNNDDILTFFDALGNTLNLKSAQISGTLDMKDSKMNIDAQILQKEDLQVATSIGLVAGDHVKNNFLNFYIKDGKELLSETATFTLFESRCIFHGKETINAKQDHKDPHNKKEPHIIVICTDKHTPEHCSRDRSYDRLRCERSA